MRRIVLIAVILILNVSVAISKDSDREYWQRKAYQMAKPLLENLSNGTLRENMPQEHPYMDREDYSKEKYPIKFTHLEAVGRLMCGIAPWLECESDNSPMRKELISLAHKGLKNGVDSLSSDFLNFRGRSQPLVDAAFLAQAFLRSPKVLWGGLDSVTKINMIRELKHTRNVKPGESNWLLFSAMIEAFLASIDESYNIESINYALMRMEQWYKGDGIYGDGKDLHNDYYNSFVIQPMMVDIMSVLVSIDNAKYKDSRAKIMARASRYAEVLERSISPEGTFPVVGRSILYRTGCMQSLSQAALLDFLPNDVSKGQVRAALTLVIKNMLDFNNTYDKNGWLKMGFCGDAARTSGESYLSTGSMYLASSIFLPLGLDESDLFWTEKSSDWTSKKAWSGLHFPIDGALY